MWCSSAVGVHRLGKWEKLMTRRQRLTRTAREGLAQAQKAVENGEHRALP